MKLTSILPREEVISLEVEGCTRTFLLREMTVKRSCKLINLIEDAMRCEAATAAVPTAAQEDHLWEKVAEAFEPVLRFILSKPTDDGGEPSEEFLSELTMGQREQVLTAQMHLNRVDDVIPKAMAIVVQVHAVRMARILVKSAGGSAVTPSEPGTAPALCESSVDGLDAKPTPGFDLPGAPSGENEPSDSPSPASSPNQSPPSA